MTGVSPTKQHGNRPATSDLNINIEQHIRDVARQATPDDRSVTLHEFDGEVVELLLELEIDGIRWLVARARPKPVHGGVILSPREREIARMVSKGYPNKTIAGVLDISTWTVGTYLRRIFAKLGVCSRAAMVARLLEEGLLIEGSR